MDTEEHLRTLRHDLRGFLHVLATSLPVLRAVRDDEARFSEVLELLERDRQKASSQIEQLFNLLNEHSSE